MKKKVYLETSVISYLTARPTTDVIKLAKQEKITAAVEKAGYTEARTVTPEELWR